MASRSPVRKGGLGVLRGTAALMLLLLAPHALPASAKKDKCRVCKDAAKRFDEGLDKTRGQNFGGGNSAWEEASLGGYATSETRLLEIMEEVCRKSDHDCNSFVEAAEEDIEAWWGTRKEDTVAGLVEAVCINDQKVCCAEDRYGKSCKKCPGRTSEGTVCSGHGTCGGAGTRKGNGKCTCTSLGHEGKACEKCKTNWFKLPDAHSEATCEKCDVACNECTGSGPGHCVECAKGFEQSAGEASLCVDIDECTSKEHAADCEIGTHCVNTAGSFSCKSCNSACKRSAGCSGVTDGDCAECGYGYRREDSEANTGRCLDIDECAEGKTCEDGKACVNGAGWSECQACHSTCATCSGTAAGACLTCAEGLELQDNGTCQPPKASEEAVEDAAAAGATGDGADATVQDIPAAKEEL